jgi:hypothetical protein
MDGHVPSLPRTLQDLLETLYGIETDLHVEDFVVNDAATLEPVAPREAAAARAAGETLLVSEQDGELALALYLDGGDLGAVAGATRAGRPLPWGPLLRVLEGVSHFVYLAWCAQAGQAVSVLELELQAEVDKFAACTMLGGDGDSRALRRRLYRVEDIRADLPAEARDRYRAAVTMAALLARALERRYVRTGRRQEMVRALRRFYRLPRAEKIAACLAA